MAASVRVQAPAKVNLHLRVYGRRQDGYHGLRSLFQAVSLSDLIVIRSLKEPDTIVIDGEFDCSPEETTIRKAVDVFRAMSGERAGLSISVRKGIPAGAGLGGGSSDAASALIGLDALFKTRLSPVELSAAGALIGSDVPFFFNAGAALVEGRGELVSPIASREGMALVVAYPGFRVATAGAYALLDRERPDDSSEPDPGPGELEDAYRDHPSRWPFANSFEPWVGASFPAIRSLRAELEALGASFAAMTGSGSCVFGIFDDSDRARRAREELEKGPLKAFAAVSLARPPYLD